MREPELLRCDVSEEALWVDGGMVRSNLHAHTDRSDGLYPIRTLARIAERTRRNIAVTDHNIAPEYPGAWPAGLIPGMEITVLGEEGEPVDFVTVGPLAEMQALFEDHVRPKLHPRRPRSAPTRMTLREVLELTRHRIIAHYGTVEGLSILLPAAQAEALGHSGGNTFVELNALTTAHNNALAERVAADWDLPLIRTGDTHRGVRQYTASGTDLPVASLRGGNGPLVDRLMDSLATRGDVLEHRLHEPSALELAATGIQVARKNGAVATAIFLLKTARRALGYIPAAVEAGIPKRLAPMRRRTMA